MNKAEAREILKRELSSYRSRSYQDLTRYLNKPVTHAVAADSGTSYQIEIEVFWDDKPEGNIRVCGAIDDGGLRAIVPITDDFIVAPDDSFVGEDE